MNPVVMTVISDCVDNMLREQIERETKEEQRRIAQGFTPRGTITDEAISEARDRWRRMFEKNAEDISDLSACYSRHRQGMLHPQNRNSRRVFTAITGLDLPSTVSGTDAVVLKYVGKDVVDAYNKAIQDQRDAEEKDRRDKQQQSDAEEHSRISALVISDEYIHGEDLVFMCRRLNVPLHPRTVGTLRNRVSMIKSDTARVSGRAHLSGTVYDAYRQCRQILTSNNTDESASVGSEELSVPA